MNIKQMVDELTRDLTAVPVPKAKSEVRRILQEKLEALLGEIVKEIEDDPAIRVDDKEYAVAIIESKK